VPTVTRDVQPRNFVEVISFLFDNNRFIFRFLWSFGHRYLYYKRNFWAKKFLKKTKKFPRAECKHNNVNEINAYLTLPEQKHQKASNTNKLATPKSALAGLVAGYYSLIPTLIIDF